MMKSTALVSSAARGEGEISTSPTPLRPWMKAEISRTSKPSRAIAWGRPG